MKEKVGLGKGVEETKFEEENVRGSSKRRRKNKKPFRRGGWKRKLEEEVTQEVEKGGNTKV